MSETAASFEFENGAACPLIDTVLPDPATEETGTPSIPMALMLLGQCRGESAAAFFGDGKEKYKEEYKALTQNVLEGDRDTLAAIGTQYVRRRTGLRPQEIASDDTDALRCVEDLHNLGYCDLGYILSSDQVDEIRASVDWCKVQDRYAENQIYFRPTDPPPEARFGHYDVEDIVNAPHCLSLMNNARILKIVGQYLGCFPSIQDIGMWWSYPGRDTAGHNQLFHQDPPKPGRYLKMFIYLTDVNADNGPHKFVVGSERLTQRLWKNRDVVEQQSGDTWPALRHLMDWGGDALRKPDDLIEQAYGSDRIVSIEGGVGKAFIVNTRNYHKAMLPRTGCRLALTISFSSFVLDWIAGTNDGGHFFPPETAERVQKEFLPDYDLDEIRYLNRYYIRLPDAG